MNKEFEYRGYRFNIGVELNHTIDRHLMGVPRHRIVLNDMGPSNYYQSKTCLSMDLAHLVNSMSGEAKRWVDKQIDGTRTEDEKLLESLGFKK